MDGDKYRHSKRLQQSRAFDEMSNRKPGKKVEERFRRKPLTVRTQKCDTEMKDREAEKK